LLIFSASTAVNMVDRAHVLSKYQVAEQIMASECWDLHGDGTSRDGKKVFGHQITLDSGKTLSNGFVPVAVEDSATLLDNAIAMMEDEISAGMPEWIYVEGFDLEENLTICLLEWEWLSFMRDAEIEEKAPDSFAFAESILELENGFSQVALNSGKLWDFFTQPAVPRS